MAETANSTQSGSTLGRVVRRFGDPAQFVLPFAAALMIVILAVPHAQKASAPSPLEWPSTMEQVNWNDPQSSQYCVACHRQVAPAIAGLDVQRGHSQNVALNSVQMQAIADLGTVAGPDNTLICMSCHKLGQTSPFMLADTLEDSRLCQHCHPGHYARGTPHDLRLSAPQEENRFGVTAAVGGPCSACHLSHRHSREIIPSALDPDGYCITCHQQYHVAEGRARTTMEHPESHCLQCHDPHDSTHGDFLRKRPSELCLTCHNDFDGGVAAGMHPLGEMDFDVPEELIVAGAEIGPSPRTLTCTTCHRVHDANQQSLLVLERRSNQLCLSCHADKLVNQLGEGVLPRHGQSPRLNEDQVAVVRSAGNRVGPNDELLCVSCHRVHGAQPDAALLAAPPHYGDTCVACHPGQSDVYGSLHDLRVAFPDSANAAQLTPRANGACSACHMAHSFPRERTPTIADPSGQCVTCHRPDGLASARVPGDTPHPETACKSCHDPHRRDQSMFLKISESQLCTGCHSDQSRLVGGPHDSTRATPGWSDGTHPIGQCLPCHVAHADGKTNLLRQTDAADNGNHDAVCVRCHTGAAWNATSDIAVIHPLEITADQQKVPLALVPKDAEGNLRIGCRTCHDPHGGAAPVHLARVAPNEETHALCLHCHEQKQFMSQTPHAAERLAAVGLDTDSCKPCHAMHAAPDSSWGQMLSPRFLEEVCEGFEDHVESCVPCVSCHRPDGPAPVRAIASHPITEMKNLAPPDSRGYLPLYNAAGLEDPLGQVACRTCHVSHGQLDLLEQAAKDPNVSAEQRRAMWMQVRPYLEPNICTQCHGADARPLFLFFHDPARRNALIPDSPRPAR